jgi:hypothetical protein
MEIWIKNQICADTSDAFTTAQRFDTREEVIRWIKEVGIRNKVSIIITRSDTETGKRVRKQQSNIWVYLSILSSDLSPENKQKYTYNILF